MTPAARLQAAIEIVEAILAAVAGQGPAADTLLGHYFRTRRYAGSKDRAAVRELVYRALRSEKAEYIHNSRVLFATFTDLLEYYGSSDPHAPTTLTPDELAALNHQSVHPNWLRAHINDALWSALLERAPLDVRVNMRRTSREDMLASLQALGIDATPTAYSPWCLRLPTGTAVEGLAPYRQGLIEVQDEASQLVVLACLAGGLVPNPALVIDLCAGAGGKSLALAAALPIQSRLIASDSNPQRLARLHPRAVRADKVIETCPAATLAEFDGQADLLLVDAPCSGSGTWRRNPEARLRLTPDRLANYVTTQAALMERAIQLLRPGGCLVYAVCSVLDQEGPTQIQALLSRHTGLRLRPPLPHLFPDTTTGLVLQPDRHGTDGFFIACLGKLC